MNIVKGMMFVVTLFAGTQVMAADIPLYPTGPAEDAAFIRFVNGGTDTVQVVAQKGQPPLTLAVDKPVSSFFPVTAKKNIKGTLSSGAQQLQLDVQSKPGEFTTVVVLPDGKGIKQVTVRDNPDDFNGLKASLAFFNLDGGCANAALRPAGRNADLFKGVANGHLQRRSINPVKLAVQLVCANANVGPVLDLGELKAGERYSVLLLPTTSGPRLVAATDNVFN
jgi:alginate O-acetyltransferase complex protein AlgF